MEQNPAPEAGALDDTDLEVELGAVGVDEKLGTQMEYYFSDDNYRADKFLRSQEDSERWIKLEVLSTFRKLKDIAAPNDVTPELLEVAVTGSHTVETRRSGGDLYIRRCVPLEDLPVDPRTPDERVDEVLSLFMRIAKEAKEQGATAVFLQSPLNHLIGLTRFITSHKDERCTPEHVVKLLDCYTLTSEIIAVVTDVTIRASYIRHISAFAKAAIDESSIKIPEARLRKFHKEVSAMRRQQEYLRQELASLRAKCRSDLPTADADALSALVVDLVKEATEENVLDGESEPTLTLPPRKERVRSQLENLFQSEGLPGWETCSLIPYGSSVTGLGSKSSDIDLALIINMDAEVPSSGLEPNSFSAGAIVLMKGIVEKDGAFCKVDAIPTARVPIIKITHTETGIECDICVNQTLSTHNSLLLKVYSCMDHRVRPLIVMVKEWAKRRGIADASNGTLSAYAWANLVIFFLQQPLFRLSDGLASARPKPILPNLQSEKLIKAARRALGEKVACPGSGPNVVDGFDVSFCHHIPSIRAAFGDSDGRGGSIGDLLDRFFNFFAFEFNWENHVVAIRRSTKLTKQHARDLMPRPRQWRLSIEDPFETSHDLGMVIFSPGVNAKILHEIQQACRAIRSGRLRTVLVPTPAFEKGESECANCGVLGHVLSRCPKLGRDKPRGTPEESNDGVEDGGDAGNGKDKVLADETANPPVRRVRPEYEKYAELCFLCGASDHSSRACPKKKNRGHGERPAQRCFTCGQSGHMKKDCPSAAQSQPKPRRGVNQHGAAGTSTPAVRSDMCFNCGEFGHKKSSCPKAYERHPAKAISSLQDAANALQNVRAGQPTERLRDRIGPKHLPKGGDLRSLIPRPEKAEDLRTQIHGRDKGSHSQSAHGLAHEDVPDETSKQAQPRRRTGKKLTQSTPATVSHEADEPVATSSQTRQPKDRKKTTEKNSVRDKPTTELPQTYICSVCKRTKGKKSFSLAQQKKSEYTRWCRKCKPEPVMKPA